MIASKALTLFCFPMKKIDAASSKLEMVYYEYYEEERQQILCRKAVFGWMWFDGLFSCATVERLYTHIHSHLSNQGYSIDLFNGVE